MYRQYSLLLVFPLLVAFGFMYFFLDGEDFELVQKNHDFAINNVIGDESFIETYGMKPDEDVPERIRIKTHLQYVEELLRKRSVGHLSEEQKINRADHLNHLREYILAGEFPYNDGHPDARRPVFISQNGHICAVGYLIEQDLGREAVESINQKFKYEYISKIDDQAFLNWVDSSGFTLRELAMIQPMYGPVIVEEVEYNQNQVGLSYGIGSTLLTSANVLYHTNRPDNPWLFNDSSSNHWFGLAAGSASVLVGALNLNTQQSFTEPVELEDGTFCVGFSCPPVRRVTVTNHTRKAVSIANIGIGLISILRSGYHLIKGTMAESHSEPSLRVTQLEPNPVVPGEPVPGVQLNVRF